MVATPDLNGLHARLAERAKREGLYYPDSLLRGLEAALALPRRFLIFYGPPGVGKSRLVQLIAEAMPAELCLIPVGADWRDDRMLRGGYAPATGQFVPGVLASLAVKAAAEPESDFAFCLDELSLGEPESYLASLLCGLDAEPPCLYGADPGRAGQDIPLPDNLFLFGTLYMEQGRAREMPRKLLDRSMLFELDFANLQQFLAVWAKPFPGKGPLVEVCELLQSHGIKLGYRVFREIGQIVAGAARVGMASDALLDQQARILPAIRGEASAVEDCLHDLVRLLSQEEIRFPETLDKAVRMLEQLGLTGYTAAYLS